MQLPQSLNCDSRRLVDALRRVYPAWEDDLNIEWLDGGGGWLAIRFPSACVRPDGDFVLDFDGGEVTLSFTPWWHSHFDLDVDTPEFASQLVEICRFLDSFFEEWKAITVEWNADKFVGSISLPAIPSAGLPPSSRSDLQKYAKILGGDRFQTRSWLGTHDEEGTIR